MKKQKKEEWRTEAKDQPLAISATPAQPLRQRTAKETNAQAGKTSKKKLQKPTEKKETVLFQHRHLLRVQQLCTLSKMLQLLITCWMRSRKSMAGCRRNSGKQLSKAWQTWSFFILDKWTQTTTTMRTSIPTLLQKSTTLIRPCLIPIPQQNLWQSPARHS
jgi:hypothetical protein